MGLHICNNCEYKMNCSKAFDNSIICMSTNAKTKIKQENRFDKTELKEFTEFLKER